MNLYGRRFEQITSFISYCRTLNVRTDVHELEYYEKIGALFPQARLIYPDNYVINSAQHRWNITETPIDIDHWPALARLQQEEHYMLDDYANLPDSNLIHIFDRELDSNPYLTKPIATAFRPWSDFRIVVPDDTNKPPLDRTAQHYYSYWQVHYLHFLKEYPDIYENKRLYDGICPNHIAHRLRRSLPPRNRQRHFEAMLPYFDFLSFWLNIYTRERNRTFASRAELPKYLTDDQFESHKARLQVLAHETLTQFGHDISCLYDFMDHLIVLHEHYMENERHKLSIELESDISHLERIIALCTGASPEDISLKFTQLAGNSKGRTFRHLHPEMKDKEYAQILIGHIVDRCSLTLTEKFDIDWTFEEDQATEMLDYCQREGLGLLVTSLSGMIAVGFEERRRKFRLVHKYSNLKNILTSFEYMLKGLGEKAGLSVHGATLHPIIRKVICEEEWVTVFEREGVRANSTQEFIAKLEHFTSDPCWNESINNYWAQAFLVTCLGRNYTVHFYSEDVRFYGDALGTLLDAVVTAICYTWKLAKEKSWV